MRTTLPVPAGLLAIFWLLLSIVGCSETTQTSPVEPQFPGRLLGRVVARGAPALPAVTVSLRDLAVVDASAPEPREVSADASGRFEFLSRLQQCGVV